MSVCTWQFVIKQNGKVMLVNFFDIIYDSKEQGENTICTKPKETNIVPPCLKCMFVRFILWSQFVTVGSIVR
jgi:hypothetical protein